MRKLEPSEQSDLYFLAVAIAKLGRTFAVFTMLLVGCAGIDAPLDGAELERCCATGDAYTCALSKLEPGTSITLVCGVEVDFPKVTRWDLANELATLACDGDERWYCAPELARTLCARKLDPYCAAYIDDGVTLEACRVAAMPGEPVPAVCGSKRCTYALLKGHTSQAYTLVYGPSRMSEAELRDLPSSERPMTSSEWTALAELAQVAAERAVAERGYPTAWTALREKCLVRASAAKEGRCMP